MLINKNFLLKVTTGAIEMDEKTTNAATKILSDFGFSAEKLDLLGRILALESDPLVKSVTIDYSKLDLGDLGRERKTEFGLYVGISVRENFRDATHLASYLADRAIPANEVSNFAKNAYRVELDGVTLHIGA